MRFEHYTSKVSIRLDEREAHRLHHAVERHGYTASELARMGLGIVLDELEREQPVRVTERVNDL